MLLSHVTDQSLIKVITCNLDGSAYYGSAKRDDCDICSTATDINDHVSAGLGNINSGTDGSCYRLLNDGNLAGTCLIGSVLNGLLLDLSRTARNADCDTRLAKGSFTYCLIDEIL